MIPDERTCQYFQTIVQEKNISHAAKRLYISQPSLSRFLSDLEKSLDTALFLRESGNLCLTAVGEQFCRYIDDIKKLEAAFSAEIKKAPDHKNQVLTIGAGSNTSYFLARQVFPVLHREYPDIDLRLVEDIHVNLISRLNSGELDMALLVATSADELSGTHIKLIAASPRLFVISRSHPLAALVTDPESNSIHNPQLFSLKYLEGQTVVSGQPGQKINDDVKLLISKYKLRSVNAISLQNLQTSLSMAECGLAVSLMPGIYIRDPKAHPECLYLYSDDPLAQWRMTIRHKNRRLSSVERRFIELASALFSGKNPA